MKLGTREEIKSKALGAVLGALIVATVSPWVSDVWDHLVAVFLPKLSPRGHLSLLATLFGISIVGWSYVYRCSSRQVLLRRYEPDPDFPGLMRHKKRKLERVCPRCLYSDGREVRFFIAEEEWLLCVAKDCKYRVQHPKHKTRTAVIQCGSGNT